MKKSLEIQKVSGEEKLLTAQLQPIIDKYGNNLKEIENKIQSLQRTEG